MHPHDYPRRILLVATGLTPQVVTETLYCLAVARQPAWCPTEIHLATTAEGANRARLTLLSREPGWFHRLVAEYRLGPIRFDADTIHTVGDGAVGDIRTPEDNERAADTLTDLVRRLTADASSALHVSLAGGRKTMGFYAGYALSLFGRPQDRLSHCLVSPPFESHSEFYYPSCDSRVIYTKEGRPVDTRDARLTLAEIPFVRLRHGLPDSLRAGTATFSDSVAAAQRALGPAEVVVDLAARRLLAGGREVKLSPTDLAYYAWHAYRRAADKAPLPCPADGVPEIDYARDFLAAYRRILAPLGDGDRTEHTLARGMTKDYFLQRRARLNSRLRCALGSTYDPYQVHTFGTRPDTRYGLALDPEAIRFAAAPDPGTE